MKLQPQRRSMFIQSGALDKAARTMRISFSSEEAVDQPFGRETLLHDRSAVRMQRINAGAPLLFNHNRDDIIGVVEKADIGNDRRGYATVRFSKSARGQEMMDMVDDGILKNTSTVYRIHEIAQERNSDSFLVTDWEPHEISLVTIPADTSVGVGRADSGEEIEVRVKPEQTAEAPVSAERAGISAIPANVKETVMSETTAAVENADVKQVVVSNDGTMMERLRVKTIHDLCRQHKVDEKTREEWIDGGITIDVASSKVLDILAERGKSTPQSASNLGMTRQETGRYSLNKALSAVLNKSWTNAGLELEAHRTIANKLGRTGVNEFTFFVPLEVQRRELPVQMQRDLTVGTANAGGYLVETQNIGFVELLRNRSVVMSMGARRLTGLVGNLTIPKQTAAGTGYWLSTEATQITESQPTLGQLALSPKTVGGYTEISRQLMIQSSPDAEGLTTSDLAQVIALAVDTAGLNGAGSGGQPTGIIGTSGIGSVTGTTLGIAGIIEFQSDVASANALTSSCGYATTPVVAGKLMQRQRFSSTDTPLWEGNMLNGNVMGFKAMSSNQMPTDDMLFGDWSQVVIGEWGVLEIEVNPYADFKSGIVGVRAMYSIDIGVRIPGAFSLASSIT